jgi:tRNA pseudouridine13 synthase
VLARAASRPISDIGYAGLKDRHAVTEQWFSIRLPRAQSLSWLDALPEEITVRQHAWHTRKLKKGALRGNAFDIIVRDVCGEIDGVAETVRCLREQGFPNYYMEQRWGVDGSNLKRAAAMLTQQIYVRDRFRRGIYLSAARALIFNKVLSARVCACTWATALRGDAFMLDGSHSFFVEEQIDDELIARVASGDLHPSGPLWGEGDPPTRAEVQRLEREVARNEPTLSTGLAAFGMKHARRALRVIPKDLQLDWLAAGTLRVRFYLPAGSYATACLRALVGYRVTSECSSAHLSHCASSESSPESA